jgi:type II secretory pathway component GspD/PulD (secretin)
VADLYRDAVEAVRNSEAASAAQLELQNANAIRTTLDTNASKNYSTINSKPATSTPLASMRPDLPVVAASWNFDQSQSSNTVTAASEFLPGLPVPKSAVSKPLINEIFEQTEIREAIEIIASTTGETVVVDDSIGGVVTLQIKDATFEQALEMLLLPLGLVYVIHEGSYLISPPDPESPLFRLISSRYQYSPRNHLPSKLAALVPKRLSPFFQVSDDRNLIAIEAPQAIGEDLLKRLQELDQPVQQVVLEAIVCVSAPDSGFKFGVDWNHTLQLNNLDQMKVGLSGLAFSGAASKYGVNNAFDEFAVTSAFVQLLAQQGFVTIRAAPRVTAKDGEKASISIERETFFSLQPTNTSVLFTQNIQKVQAGINLMITPRIRGDRVSIEIEKAEVSEDIRTSETRKELVSINRRTVSTKVDVLDGHTIVIGGLVQRQTVDRVNKVPFLGSLPGIGGLFRTVEKQEQDAEVAIFISPRIVREAVCVAPFNQVNQ